MKRIGPCFFKELQDVGLAGLPFSWTEAGVAFSPEMTPDQVSLVNAVLVAHNPDAPDATLVQSLQDRQDRQDAKEDAKLQEIAALRPAQAKQWAKDNFPTLTNSEQRALGAIVTAIAVLGRTL